MNKKIKMALMCGLLTWPLAMAGCTEDYRTYDHNPGAGNGEPDVPVEPEMPADMPAGKYRLVADDPRQIIEGLGFEIQNEMSAGADVNAPDKHYGVPLDLRPEERKRLAEEMLKGFRYMRCAMGCWFQGVTPDRKNFIERIPGQNETLVQLMKDAGVEGISLEYWSPAPYWKSNGNFTDGQLKSFDDDFLDEFGDALVRDIQYMKSQGFKVSTWGLQNESQYPQVGYAHCHYTPEQLVKTFGKVAPKVRACDPDIEIIYDTNDGNAGTYGTYIRNEHPELLQYVDAWVYHRIGDTSDNVLLRRNNYLSNNHGKPIYQNEFEYFDHQIPTQTFEWFMVNTAQSIMNWMTFIESPKWYWLHALKPIDDHTNRDGFGLGVYRPSYANASHDYPELKHGHWTFNWQNFNGIAGFLKYMDWDSQRYTVDEDQERLDNRIMAWKTPKGKFVIAVTNRSDDWFEFDITLDQARTMNGFRYYKNGRDVPVGNNGGADKISAKVRPWSIEFWVEQ